MSLYCKGSICTRSKECARAKEWRYFSDHNVKEGCATGVWFVCENACIRNNYEDGVFYNVKK